MCCSKTALHSTIHSNGSWMTPCSSNDTNRESVPDDLPEDVRSEEVAEAMKSASHLREFVLTQVRMH
jgi:hypothetical protein